MFVIFGILFTGCIVIASPYSFDPPSSLLRVERKWYVSPSAKIGSQVAKVLRDKNVDKNVTYALSTNGAPVPFEIDPHDGIVRVNDTLADKENQTYSLWVTMEGAPIFQRLEIFAIITDDAGYKPKLTFPHVNTERITTDINIPKATNNTTTKYDTIPNVPDTTVSPVIDNASKVPEVVTNSSNTNEKSDYNKNMTIFEPNKESNILLAIIPPVAIGILVIIVAAVIIFVWKKNNGKKWKKDKKDDMNKDSSGIVLQDASLNLWDRPRAYSNRYESWDTNHLQLSEETTIEKENPYDEWEFPRHKLRMFNIVGEGAFGQVFRAQAIDIDGKKGDTTVAVKTLKENASPEEKNDLLQELNVMKSLGTHPNVVRLIGCCTEKEPTLVIMEFVSLGKLQQFLRDSRAERHYGNTHADSSFLTSSDLTHFAYQVARGMDFLSSKGIIHRDLAARNILITEERMCKVADFGFARDVADTDVYERKSGGRLPIRWMAPESLYDNIFSVKSDIWSFGVLLWEIVTLGSTPYPGLSAGDVMQKVRDGHRLEKPEHCRREFYNIMYYCWEAEPSARPDFKEVVAMLERLLCTETDYIELERFPDHSYYNVQHLDGEKL